MNLVETFVFENESEFNEYSDNLNEMFLYSSELVYREIYSNKNTLTIILYR